MARGRADDTARRRQKVTKAISLAARDGGDLTASAIARHAGVDRSFLYRHHDLLEHLHRAQAAEPAGSAANPPVSRESLRADLANAHERNRRLQTRVQHLERRLSEAMGEKVWRESGLGAAADIETLQRQIVTLEQTIVELTTAVEERDRDLAAARAANRELIIRVNSPRVVEEQVDRDRQRHGLLGARQRDHGHGGPPPR
jgi:chromosome segregation ATPase